MPDGIHGLLDSAQDEDDGQEQADNAEGADSRKIGPVDIVEDGVDRIAQMGGYRLGRFARLVRRTAGAILWGWRVLVTVLRQA